MWKVHHDHLNIAGIMLCVYTILYCELPHIVFMQQGNGPCISRKTIEYMLLSSVEICLHDHVVDYLQPFNAITVLTVCCCINSLQNLVCSSQLHLIEYSLLHKPLHTRYITYLNTQCHDIRAAHCKAHTVLLTSCHIPVPCPQQLIKPNTPMVAGKPRIEG